MTDVHSSPIPAGPAAGNPAGHEDPACDVAHGAAPAPAVTRTLVAVFDSPVARYLLRYAGDAGFRPVLVEPDPRHAGPDDAGLIVAGGFDGYLGGSTDVVVTDHHRPELGPMLRDALAGTKDWKGLLVTYQADPLGDLAHMLGIYRNKGKTPELIGPISESGF